MAAIDTAYRVFVSQLQRDLAVRAAAAAEALAPGHTKFPQAFYAFGDALAAAGSPVKAAALFRRTCERLRASHNHQFATLFNYQRSRSAALEILAFEIEAHPLVAAREEGILVRGYCCWLRRNGRVETRSGKRAFLSWHALARLGQRGSTDILAANGVVAACGLAGLIMGKSEPHRNTNLNLTIGELTVVGVLRASVEGKDERAFSFFDVLTVLEIDDMSSARQRAQRDQGITIADAVMRYMTGDDPSPKGYADEIAVLPYYGEDWVTRERARV